MLRSGADHLMAVPYNEKYLVTCPVRAVGQLIEVGKHVGWDMTSGYLFPANESATERKGKPVRGKVPITAPQMSLNLKQYASEAGEQTDFSMHSFRSGGAVSRALAGDSLSSIMQKAFWKNPSTAWRCMRLMEVVSREQTESPW